MAAAHSVFILSLKSSGSSLLQRILVEALGGRTCKATTNYEGETLFWHNAASVLGLPQLSMPNSRYPKDVATSRAELTALLAVNRPDLQPDLTSEAGIFGAWSALAEHGSPPLIEKSPHHLYQPSNIALMERYADAQRGRAEVKFVGLVRNPVDTLYSSWRRFGIAPRSEEACWLRGYETLWQLKERRPELVTLVRYEDCLSDGFDPASLGLPILSRTQAEPLRTSSLGKWRQDRGFGFALSAATRDVALRYGYNEAELSNPHAGPWGHRRIPRAILYNAAMRLPESWEMALRRAGRLMRHRSPALQS